MKIGIVIIGVGRWGSHLVRIFSQNDQVKIIAIVESQPERLKYCETELLPKNSHIIFSTNWHSVCDLPGINGVIVTTPASTHYQLIKDILERGFHVLAEKPLTLNTDECQKLTLLAQQKNCLLLVDHTYLFNPLVTKGQEVIKSKILGDLRYGYATRTNLGPIRQDVDCLWDLAIHDLAIFNYWLGESPCQVQAQGQTWLQPNLADLVFVNLTYPNGFSAYLHFCWSNPDKQRRIGVVGSQGTLIFDELSVTSPLIIYQGNFELQNNNYIPTNLDSLIIEVEKAEPLKLVCDKFIEHIVTQNYLTFSDGNLATQLVHILTYISQSLRENGMLINIPVSTKLFSNGNG
jgi:predicted dehydrogenase